jgi:hypothetical protein
MTSRIYPTATPMGDHVVFDVLSLTLHRTKYNVFIMMCTTKTGIQLKITMCAEKFAAILTNVHTLCHI